MEIFACGVVTLGSSKSMRSVLQDQDHMYYFASRLSCASFAYQIPYLINTLEFFSMIWLPTLILIYILLMTFFK